ncbi:MAG: cytochrome b5 [bacterium]|nr:cytochrome b5 [bacterium]
MKEFDADELAAFNGENGNPTYIAYDGKVYDVSESKLWRKGQHMNRHRSGVDLTSDMPAAPHATDVLERFPQVGTLKKVVVEEHENPLPIARLINRFPFLRRHPHPMTIHFPIVFVFSTSFFNILYLVTGVKSFEITALNCLAGGILFTIVGIVTGIYTWWLNYMAKPLKAVKIKLPLTIFLFITEVVIFIWRILSPGILDAVNTGSIIYFLLVLSLIPMTMVIGWCGASMTFPVAH